MPLASSEEPDQAGVMEEGPESHPEQEKNAAEVVKEQLTLSTRLLTSAGQSARCTPRLVDLNVISHVAIILC